MPASLRAIRRSAKATRPIHTQHVSTDIHARQTLNTRYIRLTTEYASLSETRFVLYSTSAARHIATRHAQRTRTRTYNFSITQIIEINTHSFRCTATKSASAGWKVCRATLHNHRATLSVSDITATLHNHHRNIITEALPSSFSHRRESPRVVIAARRAGMSQCNEPSWMTPRRYRYSSTSLRDVRAQPTNYGVLCDRTNDGILYQLQYFNDF